MYKLSSSMSTQNTDKIYYSKEKYCEDSIDYEINGIGINFSKISEISLLEILRHRLNKMKEDSLATYEIDRIIEKIEEAIMWSDLYLRNNYDY